MQAPNRSDEQTRADLEHWERRKSVFRRLMADQKPPRAARRRTPFAVSRVRVTIYAALALLIGSSGFAIAWVALH